MEIIHSMKDKILLMMKEGAFTIEIAAELGFSYEDFIEYREKYSEFDELIKKGETYSMAWWMRKLRASLENPRLNDQLLYLIIENLMLDIRNDLVCVNNECNNCLNESKNKDKNIKKVDRKSKESK